jgi:hypothetical protein
MLFKYVFKKLLKIVFTSVSANIHSHVKETLCHHFTEHKVINGFINGGVTDAFLNLVLHGGERSASCSDHIIARDKKLVGPQLQSCPYQAQNYDSSVI